MLSDHVADDDYFWFLADSCNTVTQFGAELVRRFPEKASQIVLVTAETKVQVQNASEQFKNKFVLCSPSITTATDFSIDRAQDVFIYIRGRSIGPDESFQQTTRTRNIRNVFYFCEAPQQDAQYGSLDEVKDLMQSSAITCSEINSLYSSGSFYKNEDDDWALAENSFFNLWAYNEYIRDAYNTNKLIHYELLLEQFGFDIIPPLDKPERLKKEARNEMTETVKESAETTFYEYLLSDIKTRRDDPKFDNIRYAIADLGLHRVHDDILQEYQELLTNKYKRIDHHSLIHMMQSEDFLTDKLDRLYNCTYTCKAMRSTSQKIRILRQVEKQYGIGFLDVGFQDDCSITMGDALYKTIKNLFRMKRAKPTTKQELKSIYITMVKQVAGISIIKTVRSTKINEETGKKDTNYELATEVINRHLNLNQFKNPMRFNFLPEVVDAYSLKPLNEFLD